jgi:hypothetical protein
MWHFSLSQFPNNWEGEAVREFRSWLVGCAARAGLHFSLFLDETWNMLAWSKLQARG